MSDEARTGTCTEAHADAFALAEALRRARADGVGPVYEIIIAGLADTVEFRHEPPVPVLDGLRSRADSADYLRLELVAFPRAFGPGWAVTFSEPVTEGAWVRLPEVRWSGPLVADGRRVDVRMGLGLQVSAKGIVVIFGTTLSTTTRDDLVAWLKAVAATGGFRPAPGTPVMRA
jgi:hypothetical protein